MSYVYGSRDACEVERAMRAKATQQYRSSHAIKTPRTVEEVTKERKIKLFSATENGFAVGITATFSSMGATLASVLTAIYGGSPLLEILAADAGMFTVGTFAAIMVAQKLNYKDLPDSFSFKDGKPKVKFLLPGQVNIQKAETIYINEQQESYSSGLYQRTSHSRNSLNATHEVETSLVQKWNGSSLVQKVTPLPAYSWDDALESTLDIHEITEIPAPELSSVSLAVQSVKAGKRTMANRIQELEELTSKGDEK